MKPCLIKQPAGIGDIFFCQKIARYMAYHGYQIIWPISPDIIWRILVRLLAQQRQI